MAPWWPRYLRSSRRSPRVWTPALEGGTAASATHVNRNAGSVPSFRGCRAAFGGAALGGAASSGATCRRCFFSRLLFNETYGPNRQFVERHQGNRERHHADDIGGCQDSRNHECAENKVSALILELLRRNDTD